MTEAKTGAGPRLDSAITERIKVLRRSGPPSGAALRRWVQADDRRWKAALALAGLFAFVGLISVVTTVSRPATRQPSAVAVSQQHAVPSLHAEAAPPDSGKAWSVVKVWQGGVATETEAFSVGEHWRVDWLFSPGRPGALVQIYIYAADGRLLMDLAANTDKAGANSSFWAGSGRYFLKVKSADGDWKIDVQDLR